MAMVVFCDECAEYQICCDKVGMQVVRVQGQNSGSVLCFARHASVILPQIS